MMRQPLPYYPARFPQPTPCPQPPARPPVHTAACANSSRQTLRHRNCSAALLVHGGVRVLPQKNLGEGERERAAASSRRRPCASASALSPRAASARMHRSRATPCAVVPGPMQPLAHNARHSGHRSPIRGSAHAACKAWPHASCTHGASVSTAPRHTGHSNSRRARLSAASKGSMAAAATSDAHAQSRRSAPAAVVASALKAAARACASPVAVRSARIAAAHASSAT